MTPLEAGKILVRESDKETLTTKPYRSAIGMLMYPMIWTRPDLAFAVGILSQFADCATDDHWGAVMDVLRYIKSTLDLEIVYRGKDNNFKLTAYADSDWAADKTTGKSIFGYIVFLDGNPISWKSKKSHSVSTSSTTAELTALYHVVTEVIWLVGLLDMFELYDGKPVEVYNDNQAVVKVVNGEKNIECTKHETVKIEFIREKIVRKQITVSWIPTKKMVADIFTKSLGKTKFLGFREELKLEPTTHE